jgi:hypothetical protein
MRKIKDVLRLRHELGRPGAQLLEVDCGTIYSLCRRYFAALGGHSVAH